MSLTRPQSLALNFVSGYLSTRCAVSSQHKLPTVRELASTQTMDTLRSLGVADGDLEHALNILDSRGGLFRYGPHISDREIDVL